MLRKQRALKINIVCAQVFVVIVGLRSPPPPSPLNVEILNSFDIHKFVQSVLDVDWSVFYFCKHHRSATSIHDDTGDAALHKLFSAR